jgi:hypothetical protein
MELVLSKYDKDKMKNEILMMMKTFSEHESQLDQ